MSDVTKEIKILDVAIWAKQDEKNYIGCQLKLSFNDKTIEEWNGKKTLYLKFYQKSATQLTYMVEKVFLPDFKNQFLFVNFDRDENKNLKCSIALTLEDKDSKETIVINANLYKCKTKPTIQSPDYKMDLGIDSEWDDVFSIDVANELKF